MAILCPYCNTVFHDHEVLPDAPTLQEQWKSRRKPQEQTEAPGQDNDRQDTEEDVQEDPDTDTD